MGLERRLRKPLINEGNNFSVLYSDFIMLIEGTLVKFCRYASREAAAEHIDEKTARILKKLVKKPRMGIKKKEK